MPVHEKIKCLLTEKLRFTPSHLDQLAEDPDQYARLLSLLKLIKQSPHDQALKSSALSQIKQIRQSLTQSEFEPDSFLAQARAAYYTFQ